MSEQKKPSELRRMVKVSIAEGIFAQVYTSLAAPGSLFITKFAVMLGATPLQFGILSAIGQLSQVFQPLGVVLTRRLTTRKGVVVTLAAVGRSLAFFYGFLPFLLPPSWAIWAFLLLFFLSTSVLATAGNAWVAWVSAMIPLRMRGRFFSWRSQYLMVAGLLTGYLFGAFVDLFSPQPDAIAQAISSAVGRVAFFAPEHLPLALAVVFGVATLAGVAGTVVLARQPEHHKAVEQESALQILATPLRDKNFRRLLVYGFWWMLAVGIGGPFWTPFALTKLKMSLVDLQIYGTISTFASLLALRPWGVLIDRFGNKTAMRFALVLGGLNPLIWTFVTPQTYWVVYFEAATSGIMWSGANIVAVNFVLAVAPDGKQQVYSGVFGAFAGLAMMLTLLMSGAFLPSASLDIAGLHFEPEQVLFGLGGLVRWTTQIPLTWIHEPRGKPVGAVMRYVGESIRGHVTRHGGRGRGE
jgi:MFS family permease